MHGIGTKHSEAKYLIGNKYRWSIVAAKTPMYGQIRTQIKSTIGLFKIVPFAQVAMAWQPGQKV